MLKRYQVLLSDWIEDYIKIVAEKYDVSTSAVIRVHMALAIIFVINTLHPEYSTDLKDKEFQELSKKAAKGELNEADAHRVMSKILFEARKAVEFRLAKDKEQKKK